MKTRILWAAITLTMAMTACSSENEVDEPLPNENDERHDITLTRSEEQLVEQSNDFAFNLFRKAESGKSQILSPISITYALGLLNNGATGETQQQINKVLGFGETGADGINDFCHKMLNEAPNLDQQTKVMIANTIFMNKGYELKSDFVQKAKTYYDAEPETRDFHDGKTLGVINQWASDHTEKMITKVLNEQTFQPNAVSYLLNAIYFKGAWAEEFDRSNTKDESFEGNGGEKVPMMHTKKDFRYSETEDFQIVDLPYGNGAYCMTVLLPKQGKTIDDVLQGLTAETWQQFRDMPNTLVDLKLPRFESGTDIELNDIMSELGMPKAFTDMAEFPNFCNVSAKIGMMKQVARIKVNEEGTEAAAVTVISLTLGAMPTEPQHVTFHANRPFLYVISEMSTGAIFFIGSYWGK